MRHHPISIDVEGCVVTPPSEVEHDGCKYTVTSVADNAFRRKWMYYLRLPETIETIGKNVCKNCGELMYVVIPDKVVSIGDSAFSDCHLLSTVVLGGSFKEAGKDVFANPLGTEWYPPSWPPKSDLQWLGNKRYCAGVDTLRLVYKNPESPSLSVGVRYDPECFECLYHPLEVECDSAVCIGDDDKYKLRTCTLPIAIRNCPAADLYCYAWGCGLQPLVFSYAYLKNGNYTIGLENGSGELYDNSFLESGDVSKPFDWHGLVNYDLGNRLSLSSPYGYYIEPIFFFSPWEACAVRLMVFENQKWYDYYQAGVESPTMDGGEATSVEYYDLQGRRHNRPQTGVNIVVKRFSNGSAATDKTLVRGDALSR